MTVSPLLTVLGFLPGRARTVGTGDILFLIRLRLYFVLFFAGTASSAKGDSIDEDILEVTFFTHNWLLAFGS